MSYDFPSVSDLESKIGAWVSKQSTVLKDRQELEDRRRMTELAFENYNDGEITRPDNWGGFRIYPSEIEFWQGRVGRLHDRLRFTKNNDTWKIVRLCP